MRFPPGFSVKDELKDKKLEDDRSKWVRPTWFGSEFSPDYMRKIIWQDLEPIIEEGAFGQVESYIRCPICIQKCAFMGCDIDHIIDWKTYAAEKNAKTYYDLYCAYHDLDNLILLHSNCNSHKKGTLTETLRKPHTATQTATWNRPPEVVDFCMLVATLYTQESVSTELRHHVETKVVKRFSMGGWHTQNAYGSLKKIFGESAVEKAVKSLTK